MNTKNLPKLEAKFKENNLKIDFTGGDISSDAGLILVKQLDKKLGFMDNINKLIEDPRVPGKITHTQQQLLSQRIYQIIAGYEDCDDADLLRNDPIFKIIAGKSSLEDPLGSQPTFSRLENRITRFQITQLKRQFVEHYIQSVCPKKNKPIILDCDSTEDPTHGEQQLSLFNGLFDEYCYHPFLVFDSESQTLLGAHLRPGNQHSARNAPRILLPIIRRLKQKYPHKQILVRGDCALGSKKMMDFCSRQGCDYLFAVGNTASRFDPYVNSLIHEAQKHYEETQEEFMVYYTFLYSSQIWKQPIKIIAQIKVDSGGLMKRFLLTNLQGTPEELFDLYNQRGQCENYIKELKLSFKSDRLSCHSFKANSFRLLLYCFAYQLVALFKRLLSQVVDFTHTQIDTLRLKLFKIGAVVYQRSRWSWIHLSSSWPCRDTFLKLAQQLGFG